MDDKYKLVSEIDGRLLAGEEVLAEAYAALGRFAADKANEKFPEGKIRGLLTQIDGFKKAVADTTRMGKRILEIEERLEVLRKALRKIEDENARLETENLPAYEEFGRISAESCDGIGLTPEAGELFAAIQELRKTADETDERVSSLKDSREKPFLSKVFDSGKAMFLNSSKTFKMRNLKKLHQNFGRALLVSLDEVPAGVYLNAFRINRKKARENAAQAESLAQEEAALNGELRELGVEKRLQKRVKDLEIQNERNSLQLDDLLRQAGREIYEHREDFAIEEAGGLISDIGNCIEKNAEYAEERKRLEAAIQYDNLTRKIHDLREELENEEKAAAIHRSNAEKLKNTIAETEKEREAMEKLKAEGEKRYRNGGNSETAAN